MPDWPAARTPAGEVALDPATGALRRLVLRHAGAELAPLAFAHWAPDGIAPAGLPETVPPVERALGGDFFCAPFGRSDLEPAPTHGWPANSTWEALPAPPGELAFRLARTVLGARLTKRLALAPDAPILYQTHLIEGGAGGLTVAHHPMLDVAAGARAAFSPKRAVLTPDPPLEPGRNRLAAGARAPDPRAVPAEGGGTVDLTRLPIGDRHEDFCTLIEAPGRALGWTTVTRAADIVFLLRDARVLPVTMLWHSNGGRDRAPWDGRHRGVLGIEDGCAAGAGGHRAALGPNPVAAEGVPTALALGPGVTHVIAHALGAVPRPAGWGETTALALAGGRLTLTDPAGARLQLPFREGFLPDG